MIYTWVYWSTLHDVLHVMYPWWVLEYPNVLHVMYLCVLEYTDVLHEGVHWLFHVFDYSSDSQVQGNNRSKNRNFGSTYMNGFSDLESALQSYFKQCIGNVYVLNSTSIPKNIKCYSYTPCMICMLNQNMMQKWYKCQDQKHPPTLTAIQRLYSYDVTKNIALN